MKKLFYKLTAIVVINGLSLSAFSQEGAKAQSASSYFKNYLDSRVFETYYLSTLPTLKECGQVFKDESAVSYFTFIEDMKSKVKGQEPREPELFVDVEIESFTTADIQQANGKSSGGMESIADRLQPDITFYKVTFLREIGATTGMAYSYWVNLGNRWVFFPKPWRAFNQ